MNKHTLKKQLLTPLLVVVTFLGISGINTANASMISDKQTMVEMGKKFIRNSGTPSLADFDWADANMVSPAKDNPYRNGGKTRLNFGLYYTAADFLTGSLVFGAKQQDMTQLNILSTRFLDYSPKKAVLVIDYYLPVSEANTLTKKNYFFKRKIWFKKVNNMWKIRDYYTLLYKYQRLNKMVYVSSANNGGLVDYLSLCDGLGTHFPR